MSEKPKTKREWALYRCGIGCRLGMGVLNGEKNPPAATTRLEYSVYCLLSAVEDLAAAMREEGEKKCPSDS